MYAAQSGGRMEVNLKKDLRLPLASHVPSLRCKSAEKISARSRKDVCMLSMPAADVPSLSTHHG